MPKRGFRFLVVAVLLVGLTTGVVVIQRKTTPPPSLASGCRCVDDGMCSSGEDTLPNISCDSNKNGFGTACCGNAPAESAPPTTSCDPNQQSDANGNIGCGDVNQGYCTRCNENQVEYFCKPAAVASGAGCIAPAPQSTGGTTGANWQQCNPNPEGTPYGVCSGSSQYACGSDFRETKCVNNHWEATGNCCQTPGDIVPPTTTTDTTPTTTTTTTTTQTVSPTAQTALASGKCDINFGLCQAFDPKTGEMTGWVPATKAVFCDSSCALAARMNVIIGSGYQTITIDGKSHQAYDWSGDIQTSSLNDKNLDVAAIKKAADANQVTVDANGYANPNLTADQVADLQKRVDNFSKEQESVQKALAADINKKIPGLLAECNCSADKFTEFVKGKSEDLHLNLLTTDNATQILASVKSYAIDNGLISSYSNLNSNSVIQACYDLLKNEADKTDCDNLSLARQTLRNAISSDNRTLADDQLRANQKASDLAISYQNGGNVTTDQLKVAGLDAKQIAELTTVRRQNIEIARQNLINTAALNLYNSQSLYESQGALSGLDATSRTIAQNNATLLQQFIDCRPPKNCTNLFSQLQNTNLPQEVLTEINKVRVGQITRENNLIKDQIAYQAASALPANIQSAVDAKYSQLENNLIMTRLASSIDPANTTVQLSDSEKVYLRQQAFVDVLSQHPESVTLNPSTDQTQFQNYLNNWKTEHPPIAAGKFGTIPGAAPPSIDQLKQDAVKFAIQTCAAANNLSTCTQSRTLDKWGAAQRIFEKDSTLQNLPPGNQLYQDFLAGDINPIELEQNLTNIRSDWKNVVALKVNNIFNGTTATGTLLQKEAKESGLDSYEDVYKYMRGTWVAGAPIAAAGVAIAGIGLLPIVTPTVAAVTGTGLLGGVLTTVGTGFGIYGTTQGIGSTYLACPDGAFVGTSEQKYACATTGANTIYMALSTGMGVATGAYASASKAAATLNLSKVGNSGSSLVADVNLALKSGTAAVNTPVWVERVGFVNSIIGMVVFGSQTAVECGKVLSSDPQADGMSCAINFGMAIGSAGHFSTSIASKVIPTSNINAEIALGRTNQVSGGISELADKLDGLNSCKPTDFNIGDCVSGLIDGFADGNSVSVKNNMLQAPTGLVSAQQRMNELATNLQTSSTDALDDSNRITMTKIVMDAIDEKRYIQTALETKIPNNPTAMQWLLSSYQTAYDVDSTNPANTYNLLHALYLVQQERVLLTPVRTLFPSQDLSALRQAQQELDQIAHNLNSDITTEYLPQANKVLGLLITAQKEKFTPEQAQRVETALGNLTNNLQQRADAYAEAAKQTGDPSFIQAAQEAGQTVDSLQQPPIVVTPGEDSLAGKFFDSVGQTVDNLPCVLGDYSIASPALAAGAKAPCGSFSITSDNQDIKGLGTITRRNDELYFGETKITPDGVLVTTPNGNQVKLYQSDSNRIRVDNKPRELPPDNNWVPLTKDASVLSGELTLGVEIAHGHPNIAVELSMGTQKTPTMVIIPPSAFVENSDGTQIWSNSTDGLPFEIRRLVDGTYQIRNSPNTERKPSNASYYLIPGSNISDQLIDQVWKLQLDVYKTIEENYAKELLTPRLFQEQNRPLSIPISQLTSSKLPSWLLNKNVIVQYKDGQILISSDRQTRPTPSFDNIADLNDEQINQFLDTIEQDNQIPGNNPNHIGGWLRQYLTTKVAGQRVFGIVDPISGNVSGVVFMQNTNGSNPYLHEMYVPSSQRRGNVGGTLIEYVKSQYPSFYLSASTKGIPQEDLEKFYRSHGISLDGTYNHNHLNLHDEYTPIKDVPINENTRICFGSECVQILDLLIPIAAKETPTDSKSASFGEIIDIYNQIKILSLRINSINDNIKRDRDDIVSPYLGNPQVSIPVYVDDIKELNSQLEVLLKQLDNLIARSIKILPDPTSANDIKSLRETMTPNIGTSNSSIFLTPLGSGMINPILTPIIAPIAMLQAVDPILQANWPDLPFSKAWHNVTTGNWTKIWQDIQTSLSPATNSKQDLFKFGREHNIMAHGVEEGKGGLNNLLPITIDGIRNTSPEKGDPYAGLLSEGDSALFSGPHGPYYVVLKPNYSSNNDIIAPSEHTAYLFPSEASKSEFLGMIANSVATGKLSQSQANDITAKVLTYDEYIRKNSPSLASKIINIPQSLPKSIGNFIWSVNQSILNSRRVTLSNNNGNLRILTDSTTRVTLGENGLNTLVNNNSGTLISFRSKNDIVVTNFLEQPVIIDGNPVPNYGQAQVKIGSTIKIGNTTYTISGFDHTIPVTRLIIDSNLPAPVIPFIKSLTNKVTDTYLSLQSNTDPGQPLLEKLGLQYTDPATGKTNWKLPWQKSQTLDPISKYLKGAYINSTTTVENVSIEDVRSITQAILNTHVQNPKQSNREVLVLYNNVRREIIIKISQPREQEILVEPYLLPLGHSHILADPSQAATTLADYTQKNVNSNIPELNWELATRTTPSIDDLKLFYRIASDKSSPGFTHLISSSVGTSQYIWRRSQANLLNPNFDTLEKFDNLINSLVPVSQSHLYLTNLYSQLTNLGFEITFNPANPGIYQSTKAYLDKSQLPIKLGPPSTPPQTFLIKAVTAVRDNLTKPLFNIHNKPVSILDILIPWSKFGEVGQMGLPQLNQPIDNQIKLAKEIEFDINGKPKLSNQAKQLLANTISDWIDDKSSLINTTQGKQHYFLAQEYITAAKSVIPVLNKAIGPDVPPADQVNDARSYQNLATMTQNTLEGMFSRNYIQITPEFFEVSPQKVTQAIFTAPMIYDSSGQRVSIKDYLLDRYSELIGHGANISFSSLTPRQIVEQQLRNDFSANDDSSFAEYRQKRQADRLDLDINSTESILTMTVTTPSGKWYPIPITYAQDLATQQAYGYFAHNYTQEGALEYGRIAINPYSLVSTGGRTQLISGLPTILHEIDHAIYYSITSMQLGDLNDRKIALHRKISKILESAIKTMTVNGPTELTSELDTFNKQLSELRETYNKYERALESNPDPDIKHSRDETEDSLIRLERKIAQIEQSAVEQIYGINSIQANDFKQIVQEETTASSEYTTQKISLKHLRRIIAEGLARRTELAFLDMQATYMPTESLSRGDVIQLFKFLKLHTIYARDADPSLAEYGLGQLLITYPNDDTYKASVKFYVENVITRAVQQRPGILPAAIGYYATHIEAISQLLGTNTQAQPDSLSQFSRVIRTILKNEDVTFSLFSKSYSDGVDLDNELVTATPQRRQEIIGRLEQEVADLSPSGTIVRIKENSANEREYINNLESYKYFIIPLNKLVDDIIQFKYDYAEEYHWLSDFIRNSP